MAYPSGPITDAYKDKIQKTHQPTPKEKALADYVAQQQEITEHSKLQVIEDSWLGVAFLTGNQWVRFNRVQNVLVADNPPAWRVRMVLNYILPTVETFCGKITENRPGFMCLPATSDDDDVEAARQCDRALDAEWERAGMDIKIHEWAKYIATTPIAFAKIWWDPSLGEETTVEVPNPNGEPDDEGIIPRKFETRKSGEVVCEIVSGLEVGWDPGAKDKESCQWMTHANFMHIDRLRSRWPKRGKHISPNSTYESDSYSQQVVRQFRGTSGDDEVGLDRIMVIEYFERASLRYPKGLYAIVAGGVVLEQGDLPYDILPFYAVRHNTVPGRWAGEGLVKPLIPAQKELNKSESQRIENKNLHAQPKWRAEKGSISKGSITDEPGEVIQYNRTATRPPEQMPPAALSPEHRMIVLDQKRNIEDISGISDVTRGSAPASFSGRAIRHAAALDQTKLGPTVREFQLRIAGLCSHWLRLMRDNMPRERMMRVAGRNQEIEVFSFYRSQIKSTDVRVKPFSMLSRNPAIRQETVMQMYQLGMYGDPNDPRVKMQARKDMEFGDLEMLHGDRTRDRNYAREENHRMSEGEFVDVQPWEDHITHIDEHLAFMKGVDFRLLSPEEQGTFQKHLAWHYHQESQQQQGVPWWTPHSEEGEGWPPSALPQEAAPEGFQVPEAGPVDSFNPTPEELQGAQQAPMPQGMGGQPETNNAVGVRGPGVSEYGLQ